MRKKIGGISMIRLTVTVKGDIEEYIKKESERTGLSMANVCYNLAVAGYDYKRGLDSLCNLSFIINEEQSKIRPKVKK